MAANCWPLNCAISLPVAGKRQRFIAKCLPKFQYNEAEKSDHADTVQGLHVMASGLLCFNPADHLKGFDASF